MGLNPNHTARPCVHQRTNRNGTTVYAASSRKAYNKRTYLGTFATREAGIVAAEHFIATGEKPKASARGRKPGQRNAGARKAPPPRPPKPTPPPRVTRAVTRAPKPPSKAKRLAMIRSAAKRYAA